MSETIPQKKRLVAPQTLKGFPDYLPEEMIARETIIAKIRRVFEKYGFLPLDTPILEYLTTLIGTGGEEANKQLFRLESPEREAIAMRFDLTVPFARLIAQYPEKLKLPFRRYHVGPVFRADKPDSARYRQFWQFDIDAAGSESVAVDAEIIAAMCEVMREVGLQNQGERVEYKILFNNRKMLDALLEGLGITSRDTQKHVLRVIDKLQKAGMDSVRRELGPGRIDESGDPIRGVGLPSDLIEKVLAFVSVNGASRSEAIEGMTEMLPDTDLSGKAVGETRDLVEALNSMGVTESEAVLSPNLTRGLDYYTGPVFEAVLPGSADLGSIMGGGRYDHLVERFLEAVIPATGASIGLDRFVLGLRRLGKLDAALSTTNVLITSMKGVPAAELLKIASELRSHGISAEVYFGKTGDGLRQQLSIANSRGIPVAIIVGEDELKDGKASVKDLRTGLDQRAGIQDREEFRKAGKAGQVTVGRGELLQTVRQLLAS